MIGVNSGYYNRFSFLNSYGNSTNKSMIPEIVESPLNFGDLKHTLYMDCLFTSAAVGGDVSGKYDESSTDEDPVILVWGQDSKGNKFEKKIHVNDIDPKNASTVEMKALHAHLGEQGKSLGAGAALSMIAGGKDITEKLDFTQYFSDYNEMLESAGWKPDVNLLLLDEDLFNLRTRNED